MAAVPNFSSVSTPCTEHAETRYRPLLIDEERVYRGKRTSRRASERVSSPVPNQRHEKRGLVHHRVRVLAVVGTRPEVIKMFSPVQAMLDRPDEFEVYLASSGQHAELLQDALETFELEVYEDLAVM